MLSDPGEGSRTQVAPKLLLVFKVKFRRHHQDFKHISGTMLAPRSTGWMAPGHQPHALSFNLSRQAKVMGALSRKLMKQVRIQTLPSDWDVRTLSNWQVRKQGWPHL